MVNLETNKQMKVLLEYLAEAEGTKIHYNSNEHDITTMFGIYRNAHPDAEIFKEIDSLAYKLGIKEESCNWSHSDLSLLNNYIEKDAEISNRMVELATSFYQDFLKLARLNLFNEDCVIAMFSMYVNSPKLAWKSVQYAINTMVSNGFIQYHIQAEDGFFGEKTRAGLEKIKYLCLKFDNIGLLFESFMLMGMSSNYARLIKSNPSKYIKYSNGWNNRLKKLQKMR